MKVLIVDDSKLFQSIFLEALLGEADIVPVISQNSADALSVLESESIDFICVSMHLQDSDGITLTKAIRNTKEHKYTPVILFTSHEAKETYIDALKSGVTEVFHKKDLQQLINFIHRFTLQQRSLSGRILYVEDTKSQRDLISALFISKGLEVDAFATAEDGLSAFNQNDYDLVVTDIVLEGSMTGMELTNHIRRLDGEKGEVPILALTGFDDISRRIELFYLGVSDYVIKPIIEQELLARVRNLIKNKQFYFESVKQRKRAEKADKAKSEFLSSMSHELRTPLNAILGFGQILEMDKNNLSINNQGHIEEILEAGNHLLYLINEILDLASIESGKLTLDMGDVDLNSLVDQCLKLIANQAEEKKIIIINNIENSELHVNADMNRLKQVLLNLLSNAVKYNKLEGQIIVDAKVTDKKRLRLSITDSGDGLTKEQINKLFTPFERLTVDGSIQGTGIGLVITKNLLEHMSGAIGVVSDAGKGCSFWLELDLF